MRRAAFLDRDGVINRDTGYVHDWAGFEILPGVEEALRRLHLAGYLLVVVTNQSGIARGYYSEAAFAALSARMCAHFAAAGAPIAGVYHCPHHPDAGDGPLTVACDCRKPAPGMIEAAVRDLEIDRAGSVMIGDKASDVAAGQAAGLGATYRIGVGQPHASLADCVAALLDPSAGRPGHA